MNPDQSFDEEDNLREKYIFNSVDRKLIAAAKLLLRKAAAWAELPPAQLITIAKLLHMLSRLPHVDPNLDAQISVSSPRKSFGEIKTFHWWDVIAENGILRLTSGGHFYQPSTGGDTFTSMIWEAHPGEETELQDFSENNSIVPDLQTYRDGVASVNFAGQGYSITVTDSDNSALDEMEEYSEEDATETEDVADREFTLTPVDGIDAAIARLINAAEVYTHEPDYAFGVEACDACQCQLTSRGFFVDGMLKADRSWANLCIPCFNVRGSGIGWGKGQLYALQPKGDWRLVAGFRPIEE